MNTISYVVAAGVGDVIGTGFKINKNVSNLNDVNYTSITSFSGIDASNLPFGSLAYGIMITFRGIYMVQMYIPYNGGFAVYIRTIGGETWDGATWNKL